MKIAHIAAIQQNVISGPRNSVTKLSAALNEKSGISSTVYTTLGDKGFCYNGENVELLTSLDDLVSCDIVIFSGFFQGAHVRIAKKIRRSGIPYLITPRGSFIKAALRKGLFKKFLFFMLGGASFVGKANGVHFLTEGEVKNSLLLSNKNYVCSNILSPISYANASIANRKNKSNVTIGYVGRYDVKHKGLDILVNAIVIGADNFRTAGVKFVLHGSDYRNGKKKLTKLLESNNISDIVQLKSSVEGQDKQEFLQRCDAFVHASRYEGQPQAVMEAMGHGVPVFVTDGTNMTHYETEGIRRISSNPNVMWKDIHGLIVDTSLLLKARTAAKEFSSYHFSKELVVDQFLSMCSRILSNRI